MESIRTMILWSWLTFTLQFREVVRPCLVWKTRDIVRSFQSVAEFLAANQDLRTSAGVVTAKNKIRIGFGFYIRTSWNWEEIGLFFLSLHTLKLLSKFGKFYRILKIWQIIYYRGKKLHFQKLHSKCARRQFMKYKDVHKFLGQLYLSCNCIAYFKMMQLQSILLAL